MHFVAIFAVDPGKVLEKSKGQRCFAALLMVIEIMSCGRVDKSRHLPDMP